MSSRRSVHIPIVQPGGAGSGSAEDRLIEVYTQAGGLEALAPAEREQVRKDDAKAREKDWDQVATPLRKAGMYQAGCAAASAVRKLGLKRPLTAVYQQVSRLAWIEGQRLHPATPRGPTEGRSAELGLALVLLMGASGSRARHVIATGALGGQPPGIEEDDVEILPVGSVPEKLQLVLTLARHRALPGLKRGRRLLFFTPTRFERAGRLENVADLAEIPALAEQGVDVVPVARLSQAAAILKAHRARHLLADQLAAALVALVVLGGGIGVGTSAVRESEVPMTFLPGGGAALEAVPFQVCFTADGGYYPVPLRHEGIGFTIPAGETLGWRVRVGRPLEEQRGLGAWFAPDGYHVAQVMVSEHSPAKVIVPERSGSGSIEVAPGGVWEWGWKLNARAESNGLVLLARGDGPFDPDALRARVIERFPEAGSGSSQDPALDVTAVTNFVAGQAPGSIRFVVQTVEEDDRCD